MANRIANRITYRATEAGLKLVDERRIKRGWSKKSAAFADAAKISQATLGRFWMPDRHSLDKASIMGIFAAVGISDWEAYSEVKKSTNSTEDSTDSAPNSPSDSRSDSPSEILLPAGFSESLSPKLPLGLSSRQLLLDYPLPDHPLFFGRSQDLELLTRWAVPDQYSDQYQVIYLWGLGGIGKSALAVKLARQLLDQGSFQGVIWQSMQFAPALPKFLADLLSAFTQEPVPAGQATLAELIALLRRQRLLLIFDGWEALFGGDSAGIYQDIYKDYKILLSELGQHPHQSTVLVTSRERSGDATQLGAKACSYEVPALAALDAFQLLNHKGLKFFTPEQGKWLVEIYRGNPLALQLVAACIRDHFNSNIAEFLHQNTVFFDESMRSILVQQTQNLSALEQQTLIALAQDPDPVDRDALKARFAAPSISDLVNALASLERRSLLERTKESSAGQVLYGLQPMVRKYVRQNRWI
jgi:hypothetical protein